MARDGLSRRQAGGLTVAELLVAVFLASMLLAALGAFYASGIRNQSHAVYKNVLHNEGLVALKIIQQQLGQATIMAAPGTGGQTAVLQGGVNVNPVTLQPLIPAAQLGVAAGQEMRFFHFCVELAGGNCPVVPCPPGPACPNNCLWFYEGPIAAWPPGAIACGNAGPGRRLLSSRIDVGGPAPFNTQNIFRRPYTDIVRVDFLIRRPRDNARQIPEVRVPSQQDIRLRLPL